MRVAMTDETANGSISVEMNVLVGWGIDAFREVHIDDCADHDVPAPDRQPDGNGLMQLALEGDRAFGNARRLDDFGFHEA